jgi:glucokinase-like ROK family protein
MALGQVAGTVPPDQVGSVSAVLDAVRHGEAQTRPQLSHKLGLGRNVVTQRVARLVATGLLVEGTLGQSTGGRAPRKLSFNAQAGRVLVAELDATYLVVGQADLQGNLSDVQREALDVRLGPVPVLNRIAALFEGLLKMDGTRSLLWGIGVGLPGPVEFATGKPVAPPIMPGWDDYDVRHHLEERFGVPVLVDNDVNVMALGELRAGLARGVSDVVYIKVGAGIGAGLVSGGRLHRGAQGSAGDIGHIQMTEDTVNVCRCGKVGCLEASAGGFAVERMASALAREGSSDFLAERLRENGSLSLDDVKAGAQHGDRSSMEVLVHSARLVGGAASRMVSTLNPSLILVGGDVADAGDDLYLAEVRQAVLQLSSPLATRDLQISRSPDGDRAGLRGAAFMVIDHLLTPRSLATRIATGGAMRTAGT